MIPFKMSFIIIIIIIVIFFFRKTVFEGLSTEHYRMLGHTKNYYITFYYYCSFCSETRVTRPQVSLTPVGGGGGPCVRNTERSQFYWWANLRNFAVSLYFSDFYLD